MTTIVGFNSKNIDTRDHKTMAVVPALNELNPSGIIARYGNQFFYNRFSLGTVQFQNRIVRFVKFSNGSLLWDISERDIRQLVRSRL